MPFFAPEQITTLADAIGDRYRVAILTAAYTGLRAGELWALKLPRVNLLKRRLEVVEALSEVRGELVVGPTKTRNRRTVTLPGVPDRDSRGAHRPATQRARATSSARPKAVHHHDSMRRHFYPPARAAVRPEGLRFHDLRHTCAAILTGQGWNPKQIQQRLGHTTIRTTLDRYAHLFEGHDANQLEDLDQAFRVNFGPTAFTTSRK